MTPSLWRLTLDTNPEDCNAMCIMCEEHSPHSDFIERLYQKTGKRRRRMPPEWLENIFREASELGVQEVIPSTMGEPLIYAHFERIIELCRQFGIRLNLTTNGTFPRKPVEDWAGLIVPVTSDVKFSWNGATRETYERVMKGISFDQVLDHLQRFIAVRDAHAAIGGNYCRVSLQLTFMETNMHELPDIIELAAGLGVDRVKGHHLWAHFDEIKNEDFRRSADSVSRWNQIADMAHEARDRYLRKDGTKVLLENIYPIDFQLIPGRVPDEFVCPFLDRELWVSPNGDISPCCAPDELRKSLGNFSNIQTTSLTDVLSSPAYRDLVANYREKPLCRTCNMRKPL